MLSLLLCMRGSYINMPCFPLPTDFKKKQNKTKQDNQVMIMVQQSSWSDGGDPVRSRCPDYDRTMWKTGVINKGVEDYQVRGENGSLSR